MPVPAFRYLTSALALLFAAGCANLAPGPQATSTATPQATPAAAPKPGTAPTTTATPTATPAGLPATGVPTAAAALAALSGARPASAPAGAAAPQPPAAATPPPFGTVVKDARRIDGPITAWQKDDKVWLELRPDQLGKPFLFTPKIRQGIGEGLLLGGLVTYATAGAGGANVVEFVRVHNTIRLQARNVEVTARDGTPEQRAVQSSYSNSLLGAAAVASQPHPDRKSILIDATPLFLYDMAGVGMQLQRLFRQGYSQDRSNSLVTAVRASESALIIETETHWFTGNVSAGAPTSPLAALAGVAPSTVPRWLPDTRSLLIGQHLSLTPLPDKPMATRRADPRVGLFATRVMDFSDDLSRTPARRFVTRWRLEKKDPAAASSEPVKPITFWIDRNVPLAYRDTVRSAILEWNKAFEAIGFKDAIKVEQQADDARFDTLDPGYPSVRWLMSAEPNITAIGQTQIDPRSGEIVDADISFEGLFTRAQRYARTQLLAARAARGAAAEAREPFAPLIALPGLLPPASDAAADEAPDHAWCRYGDAVAEQAQYALDLMQARGDLEPGGAEAQQFVLDYVKDTVMHEVGHALGLRHNFRASRVYSEAQLADPEFTRSHGTTGSVMEYNAINLALPGHSGGVPFQLTLGPYDYWAIEYAYKPAPAGASAADEEAQLQAVAGRSNEPLLAYGTDEDAYFGIDAETIQFDLGADPLAFASKRLAIAREVFQRQETRQLPADRDYSVLRRSLNYALADATRALGVLVRQLGGLRTLRDFPGSGRDPLEPVPTAVQRQAFDAVVGAVFAADGFRVSAALQRRLAPDYLDRAEIPGLPIDYNVPQRLLDLQRAVLAYLMSDQLATRLMDANGKLEPGASAFDLPEIYRRLGEALWSDVGSAPAAALPLARRELQREHASRLAFALLRPTPGGRADARGVQRLQAQALLKRIEAALRHPPADEATRLHLVDCADSLRQALAARLPRLGI
ncbi:MAG: zinc-dependent metalloprotease [Proteobacteria bacterium]|nr:zinc-dependent metalloprotease [Pseudomonadota bacterium]